MYPDERSLVEEFKNRPFVLLGVNSDAEPKKVRRLIKLGKVTWNSWMDGSPSGPISTRWDISGWPSIFVLDHRGVIRHRGRGNLHGHINTLLEEAEEEAGEASADE